LVKQIQANIATTFFSNDTRTNGLGWMANEGWRQTVAIVLEQGILIKPINLGSFPAARAPLR